MNKAEAYPWIGVVIGVIIGLFLIVILKGYMHLTKEEEITICLLNFVIPWLG